MKRQFYLFFVLLLGFFSVNAQQVLVTDKSNVTTPASGAMFDVDSDSKGFMLPRVALTGFKDVTTIPSRTTGLMVYNNGTAGLTDKGIYFWNDTVWVKQLSAGSSSTSYVAIAGDGTVKLNGGATTYNDLIVNINIARNSGNSAPGWTLFCAPGIYNWEYANVDAEELFFSVQLPHDYKEGTRIFPHIHWSTNIAKGDAPGTNRVAWFLDYQWVNHQSAYSSSAFTTIGGYALAGVTGRSLAAYEHAITPMNDESEFGGIDGAGKTISSILVCRLRRTGTNSNDTYNGSAFLLSFDFHYQIDSFGSGEPFIK